ncbi:TetR/AcrR family transcriptional regulator [Cellulomonas sp. PhB150]|uniref:TetR/AcrR family transcriptional regulator n=1 Tax=Cellulomonas sp. PhB150 TaxID=2485188 RepID=UPI000FAF617C|nr:TetR/AcrR family transcriptional regulator [Cellulomonas sp. PhB150]ROS23595.1 TetR family transcriptional regulator [Cellulomonas sp. PhB150]
MPRGGGTRDQILGTAMRLFVEQGYDKTSLREIAEAVGVTKAALYYHFRTKDELVASALAEYRDAVAEIVTWLRATPPSRERNEEFVDRMTALMASDGGLALRFGQANPTLADREEFGETHVDAVKSLVQALVGEDPDAEASVRGTLAFGALVIGALGNAILPVPGGPGAGAAAGRTVALEILAPLGV